MRRCRELDFLIMAVMFGALACGRQQSSSFTPLPCPAEGLPSPTLRAGRDIVNDSGSPLYQPPMPIRVSVPMAQLSAPRGTNLSITARLVVDTAGLVMRDSITICGARNRRNAMEVARLVAQMTFRPARRGGISVVAPYLFQHVMEIR
jgi:hypothetical protein